MSNPTIPFFSMPFNKFPPPAGAIAGGLYYASDTQSLFAAVGGAYFELNGLIQAGVQLEQQSNAVKAGYLINPASQPQDGQILQFDFATLQWNYADPAAAGVTVAEATAIAVAMAIALG